MPFNPTNFINEGRKILGTGKSYTSNWPNNTAPDVIPPPLLFLKPTSSYTVDGTVEIPIGCEVCYEVELAIVIGKEGKDIPEEHAEDYIAGYALAMDMGAVNVLSHARQTGLSWAAGKGMDTFTPISRFIPKSDIPDPRNVDLRLLLNGQIKQSTSTSDLIYSIPHIISFASSVFKLQPGDTILTGTPAGMGCIAHGDHLFADLRVEGKGILATLEVDVVQRTSGYAFVG